MQYEISIIPADPQFVPSKGGIQLARDLMEEYFSENNNGYDIGVGVFPKPRFFTAACDRFACPECSTVTQSDDATEDDPPWYEWLEAAEDAPNALTHRLQVPCCGKKILLSCMIFYDGFDGIQAAIGRFKISLDDIDPDYLDDEFLPRMEQASGCKVIQLLAGET